MKCQTLNYRVGEYFLREKERKSQNWERNRGGQETALIGTFGIE